MRTLFPTLLCLSLLLILGLGCNKDTAGAGTGNDTFLAPASAPDLPPAAPVDPEAIEEMGGKAQEMVDDGLDEIQELQPGEEAAAKRQGPGRLTPSPVTKSTPAPTTASTKPTPAGSPGKPVMDYNRALFALSKTACYGGEGCRQYSLELTNDRRLVLDAKRNMKRKGKYSRLLSATEYNALLSAVEGTNPAGLGAVYPADTKNIPADAQATVLRYADVHGAEKKVEVYDGAPRKLAQLITDLEAWVDKDGWVKMAE